MRLLAQFIAYEFKRGLSASSLKLALCGTRHMWLTTPPYRDPSAGSAIMSKILAAFQADVEQPAAYKLALPPSALLHIFNLRRSADPVVPFILIFAYVFFLRVSEYATASSTGCRLTVGNIQPTTNSLRVHIRLSKTSTKPSDHERAAAPGSPHCPLQLYHTYAATRKHSSPDSPAFQWLDGSPVTDTDVNNLITELVQRAGLPAGLYSSHSLRAGGATAAFTLDKMEPWILREGRWASVKSLMLYIRTLPEPNARNIFNSILRGVFDCAW